MTHVLCVGMEQDQALESPEEQEEEEEVQHKQSSSKSKPSGHTPTATKKERANALKEEVSNVVFFSLNIQMNTTEPIDMVLCILSSLSLESF